MFISLLFSSTLSHAISFLFSVSFCRSGYKMNEFNWEKYLESCNAQAAPKYLFKSPNSVSAPPCADSADISYTDCSRRMSLLAVNSASCRLKDADILYSFKKRLQCKSHGFIFIGNLSSFTPGVKKKIFMQTELAQSVIGSH